MTHKRGDGQEKRRQESKRQRGEWGEEVEGKKEVLCKRQERQDKLRFTLRLQLV
jgi:hypothetical protein